MLVDESELPMPHLPRAGPAGTAFVPIATARSAGHPAPGFRAEVSEGNRSDHWLEYNPGQSGRAFRAPPETPEIGPGIQMQNPHEKL